MARAPAKETVTMEIGGSTLLMLEQFRRVEAEEPPEPDPRTQDAHQVQEAALAHYEWQRTMNAYRLILSQRLLSLALDQL